MVCEVSLPSVPLAAMRVLVALRKWAGVNGGVLTVAGIVSCVDSSAFGLTQSRMAASVVSTAVLYALAFFACAANLRGRPRAAGDSEKHMRPVSLGSVVWHPIGSACERWAHAAHLGPQQAASSALWFLRVPLPPALGGSPLVLALGVVAWWAALACRLFLFELAFDVFFYAAHRAVHSPLLYRHVHKLHHAHTHDVRLISSLQMSAADVVLTHTLPLLAALALVPIAPGLEMSVAKGYLLFQELYGHAGVRHRGKNFGPAPCVASWLGITLRSEDHQRHHINGAVNFSKRFSLCDRLLGTWSGAGAGGGCTPRKETVGPQGG